MRKIGSVGLEYQVVENEGLMNQEQSEFWEMFSVGTTVVNYIFSSINAEFSYLHAVWRIWLEPLRGTLPR